VSTEIIREQPTSHIQAHARSVLASIVAPSWRALMRTDDAWAPAVMRIILGAVMFPHGAQKALGWFGGGGVSNTVHFFSSALGVPPPITLVVIGIEFVGAVALILGVFTRVAAAAMGAVMLGAVAMVHAPNGFFMNWFGNQAGEGFEYHLLVLGMVAALVISGGGRASVDRRLALRR
jgi:putative oxidoreductase